MRTSDLQPTHHIVADVIPLSRWDYPLIDPGRWALCSEAERAYLQGVISATMNEIEARRSKDSRLRTK